MKRTCLALLLCFCLATPLLAQQQISGNLSGYLGPGLYLVVGDIQVRAGTNLTILPGTTLLHNGHYYWFIYGELVADGTQTDSIFFVRQQPVPEHRWGGIRFMPGASASSVLDHCVIDNALIASGAPSTYSGGGLYSNGVGLTVSHTRISNCDAYWHGGGMYVLNATGFTVDHCLIVDNEATLGANGGGIYFYNCTEALVSYSVIARNGATGT